jgi:cytochrome c-type biogenesis protein
MGLGLPFVVAAMATEWMTTASRWLRSHATLIGRIGGMFLITIGVLEVSGAWHAFVVWLQVNFPSSNALL